VILVDTSVWVDHLRRSNEQLSALLHRNEVLAHCFVIGELALGGIDQRGVLAHLMELPAAKVASDEEVLWFIEQEKLHGSGIGYVDAHLLAATRIMTGTMFWTRDKRLHIAAEKLGLAAHLLQ
jgi:predicted nucleic acid-binding protein